MLYHSIKWCMGSCLKCPTTLKGVCRLLAQKQFLRKSIWIVKVRQPSKIKSLKSLKGLLSVNFRTECTEGIRCLRVAQWEESNSALTGIHCSIAFYYFSAMLGLPPLPRAKLLKLPLVFFHYLFACLFLFCEPVLTQLFARSCLRLNHASDTRLTQPRSWRGRFSILEAQQASSSAKTAVQRLPRHRDSSKRRRGAAGGSKDPQTPPRRGSRIRTQESSRRAPAGEELHSSFANQSRPQHAGKHQHPAPQPRLSPSARRGAAPRARTGSPREPCRARRRGRSIAGCPRRRSGTRRPAAAAGSSWRRERAVQAEQRRHLTAPPCRAAREGGRRRRAPLALSGRSAGCPSPHGAGVGAVFAHLSCSAPCLAAQRGTVAEAGGEL